MSRKLAAQGSRDGAVVKALFHQCSSGSFPGIGFVCGLSLLSVLFLAPRGSPFSPLFKNQHIQIPIRYGLFSSTLS